MTTQAEAEAIVAAANAWLLTYLTTGEGVFSYVINGRQIQLTDPDKVRAIRREYAQIAAAQSGRRRSYARFDA